MLGLLSGDRGTLDVHMKVFAKGEEEHLRFEGRMMMEFAVRLVARWLGGYQLRNEIEPVDGLVVMMLFRGKYWIAERAKASDETIREICAGMSELRDETKKVNFLAQEVRIFNPAREKNVARPLMRMRKLPGVENQELLYLDCSLDEAAGLLYVVKGLHLGLCTDIYSQEFFSAVPLKKAPPPVEKTRKKSAELRENEPKNASGSLSADAALYRKLQNYHLQSLLP